jgi:hypothetical protein
MSDNARPSPQPPERFPWKCLAIPAALSACLFLVAAFRGPEAFRVAVSLPDGEGYTSAAWSLLKQGTMPRESVRTLGYPLFLAGCFGIGGETYGAHVAIAVQLVLNLMLMPLSWSYLTHVSNQVSRRFRLIAAYCVWFAGLGLAALLMTDLLAAFCFNVFLFGFCFRRTRRWVALAGGCLLFATLARPAFNGMFVLLPFLALLVNRFARRIPWKQVAVYSVCSICGFGVNSLQERYSSEVKGREISVKEYGIMFWNARYTLGGCTADNREAALAQYRQSVADRMGKDYEMLSRREKETGAWRLLRDLVFAQPSTFVIGLVEHSLKTLVAPVDSLAGWGARFFFGPETVLPKVVRFLIFLLCMPLWLLAYLPGKEVRQRFGAYLIFSGIVLAYVVGLTALLAEGCGERYRLPLLMMILVTAALQADVLSRRFPLASMLHRAG